MKICLLVGVSLAIAWSAPIQAQEIDHFYLDLLEKGESSFQSGKFDKAISQLKTSLFGLHADKTLKAKALIYLSLSSYYIKESSQSRDYLQQALNLMGDEGFSGIDLDERFRGEISGLVVHFRLGESSPEKTETKIVGKPEPNTSESENPGNESGSNTSPDCWKS